MYYLYLMGFFSIFKSLLFKVKKAKVLNRSIEVIIIKFALSFYSVSYVRNSTFNTIEWKMLKHQNIVHALQVSFSRFVLRV